MISTNRCIYLFFQYEREWIGKARMFRSWAQVDTDNRSWSDCLQGGLACQFWCGWSRSNRWELTVLNVEAMASNLLERLTWMNTRMKWRWQSSGVHPDMLYTKSHRGQGINHTPKEREWEMENQSHVASLHKTEMRTSCPSLHLQFIISTSIQMLVEFDSASFIQCHHELMTWTLLLKQGHPILLFQQSLVPALIKHTWTS